MAKVEIYYTRACPYCIRALSLLRRRQVDFMGIDVGGDSGKRREMAERIGGREPTVPQIFINGEAIGGCEELLQLDFEDKLEPMLR